jgi:hypothetical protein
MTECVFGKDVADPCPVLESFARLARKKQLKFGMLSGFCQVCPYLKNPKVPFDINIWQPSKEEEKPDEQ